MSSPTPDTVTSSPPAIVTTSLTYHPTPPSTHPLLSQISLSLPPNSRTLLLGANGSGKTTLLRLLSGSRLSPPNSISIHGNDPFTTGLEGVTYLGLEWVLNPIVRTDIGVEELLKSMGGDVWPERKRELVEVLDVDLTWRMHRVSDGERRRVQLAMGLLRPWKVLLLDEVTVDLDLLARSELLAWLKAETEKRKKSKPKRQRRREGREGREGNEGSKDGDKDGDEDAESEMESATVVYATHILDGLDGWASHVVHMHGGEVKEWGPVENFITTPQTQHQTDMAERVQSAGKEVQVEDKAEVVMSDDRELRRQKEGRGRLGDLVLSWLKQDLKDRGPRRPGEDGQGKTYESLEGRGGYGFESRRET